MKLTLLPILLLSNMEDSTEEITIKEEPIIWDDATVKQEDDLSANLNVFKSEERFNEESLSIDQLNQPNDTEQVWIKNESVDNVRCYSCNLCRYKTDRKKKLIRHSRAHFCTDQFYCGTCGYKTNRKYSLIVHMKIHRLASHSTVQKFQEFRCDLCKFVTMWKNSLVTHQRVHNFSKRYSCDFCRYTTWYHDDLKLHKKSHVQDNKCDMTEHRKVDKRRSKEHLKALENANIVCKVCGARFTQKRYFTAHMVKHESVKLRCNVCKFMTFEEDEQREHARQHVKDDTLVQCEICNGIFKKKCIKKHLKEHADEKRYPCYLCGYKSLRKCDLTTHLKLHDMKNHLTCETCGYKTSYKYCLLRHAKMHTSNDN